MNLLSQFIGLYAPAVNPLKVTATIVSLFVSLKASVTMLSKGIRRERKKTTPLEDDMWAIE